MSRIGKLPIPVESGVKVAIDGNTVSVQGPKGAMSHTLPRGIEAVLDNGIVTLSRSDESKAQRSLHGLTRALIANSVTGVSKGFTKELEIHGVGYRAEVQGKSLTLQLGFSHPVDFPIPESIQIEVEKKTNKITITGYDRQQVGQAAADIRALRPPDVYKLKGVRYADERLRKKAGKTAAK